MGAQHKLTQTKIRSLPPGKYGDGAGLWLWKREDGGAQWLFRYTIHGRRRTMGLGGWTYVTLAEAREEADKWRRLAKRGVDPKKERDRLRREAERDAHLFGEVAREAFEARKASLRDEGKAGQWFNPIENHVLPRLGKVPIAEVDQNDLKDVLQPLWREKPETARKIMGRLGVVFRHAAAAGLDVDLQVPEKAKALLGAMKRTVRHVPALPWRDVPEFYRSLCDEPTATHLALRLLILTAARSGEVRFCHEDEVQGDVWTIEADRMKTGAEHRVPLVPEALAVLDKARMWQRDGHFFTGPRGAVISDMTLSRYMERRGMEARPHGFRSSFRDWAAEATDVPGEVAEMCLAHKVGSRVELSYRRTDYLDQRRALMQRWARHVTGVA